MVWSRISFVAVLIVTAMAAAPSALAQGLGFESQARHAVIMDYETGIVLHDHNGDAPMPPASMSKLMTAFMVFEAIEAGALTLEDELLVSENAWRRGGAATGGSTMFLEVNSRVSVSDLLRGVIVQSGNDACIVLAEALAGSEEAFARAMTARAQELGLSSASFANATGWPHPEHRISARDLAELARIIIRDHGDLYRLYAETEFTWNGIRQTNRNPLLGTFAGADGLKTGHTEESGYGLVGSAVRDGVRRIIVFNGTESILARSQEAERLMRAAFAEFRIHTLFEAGEEVASAPVLLGEENAVGLSVVDDVTFGYHTLTARNAEVGVVYDGPLRAPITAGTEVGRLRIDLPGGAVVETPVVANADVAEIGRVDRALAALTHLIRESAQTSEAGEEG